ncbi:MAG: hypothetical protein K2K66_01475 [Ruminococcus sp.]|nr:hypothetical protein [Ruminococcus sp.]
MHTLIKDYRKSCALIRERIKLLTEQKNNLVRSGKSDIVNELNIEKRLRLLYVENTELEEIIEHLEKYAGRVKERGKA